MRGRRRLWAVATEIPCTPAWRVRPLPGRTPRRVDLPLPRGSTSPPMTRGGHPVEHRGRGGPSATRRVAHGGPSRAPGRTGDPPPLSGPWAVQVGLLPRGGVVLTGRTVRRLQPVCWAGPSRVSYPHTTSFPGSWRPYLLSVSGEIGRSGGSGGAGALLPCDNTIMPPGVGHRKVSSASSGVTCATSRTVWLWLSTIQTYAAFPPLAHYLGERSNVLNLPELTDRASIFGALFTFRSGTLSPGVESRPTVVELVCPPATEQPPRPPSAGKLTRRTRPLWRWTPGVVFAFEGGAGGGRATSVIFN
jgi:hypothetical protein